jgi:HD-GYP domain-containing protein (c-di-GMP phosphodiesterase class II)
MARIPAMVSSTSDQLRQAQGLHAIDLAITASLDLNVTLNVLLTQVVTQLRADAADVLRFDPETQTLEYLAGLGFRAQAIEESQLRLGKEYAGRAALERRVISEPDLQSQRGTLLRSFLCTDETFASCVCVPLIAKGQLKGVLEIFYRTPISPETPRLEVMEAIGTQAAIAMDNAELFDNLQRSNLQLALTNNALIEGWARTLALRDPASAEHTERVAELTLRLAQFMQVREAELPHLRHGALLHDVGKLASPAALWRKRGAFTRKEQQSLRHEPLAAYDILSANAYLRPLLDIPYGQHERWDGSGYPRGLAGENIPVAARVFAIAHAWDTLTVSPSDQPTRTRDQARQYLRRMAGKQFDPRVVQTFLQIVDEAGVAKGKGNA